MFQKLLDRLTPKARIITSYVIVVLVYAVAMPAVAVVLGGIVDRKLHLTEGVIPSPYNYVVSIPVIVLCWCLIIWTSRSIVKIGEGHPAEIFNVEVSPVTQKLIVVGPYHRVRNPMATGNITSPSSISRSSRSPPCSRGSGRTTWNTAEKHPCSSPPSQGRSDKFHDEKGRGIHGE